MMYVRPAPYIARGAIGDPGIFSSIGRALGGVARVAGSVLPGPIGTLARGVGNVLTNVSTPSSPLAGLPVMNFAQGGPGAVVPVPGVTGTIQRILPGGSSGYTTNACLTKDGRMRRIRKDGKCWKRPSMNPLNPRAARRAITRIKGARRILQAIEREMPHRAARKGCGCGTKRR